MRQRPTGVAITAVLSAIGGVLGIFGGLSLALLGGLAGAVLGSGSPGAVGFVMGGLTVVLGGFAIALAYGLWVARPWAWPLGVVLALVEVGWQIALLVVVRDIVWVLVYVAIWGVVLYSVNQPHVRKSFGR